MNKFAKYVSLVAIVAFFVTFWWLNTCTHISCDDCYYGSLPGVACQRMGTIANAFWATTRDMHRPVVHFVCRICCGVYPKWVFNIANTGVMLLFLFLIFKNAIRSWKPQITQFIVAIALVYLILCKGESYLWIAGATNYLWAGTAALAFCLLRRMAEERTMSVGAIIAFAIPAFILGWTMEGFVFPILFGMGLVTLIRKFKLTKAEWVLYICYAIGALVLASAEGGRVSQISHLTPSGIVVNTLKILMTVKAVWLVLITFCFVKNKKDWLRENRFELSVVLGTLAMIFVAGFNGERSLWAANLFAIIVLLRTWKIRAWQAAVVSLCLLPLFVALSFTAVKVYDRFESFLQCYMKSSDGIVPQDREMCGMLSRFFYQVGYSWNPGTHNESFANYYGRGIPPVVLPSVLYEGICVKGDFCNPANKLSCGNFYTTPDITTIVMPLVDADRPKVEGKKPRVVYGNTGIKSSMQRTLNRLDNPQPAPGETATILRTKFGQYVLISKEYGSDKIIKGVVFE